MNFSNKNHSNGKVFSCYIGHSLVLIFSHAALRSRKSSIQWESAAPSPSSHFAEFASISPPRVRVSGSILSQQWYCCSTNAIMYREAGAYRRVCPQHAEWNFSVHVTDRIKRAKRALWAVARRNTSPRKIFDFRHSDLLRSFLVPFWGETARVGQPTAKSSHCVWSL